MHGLVCNRDGMLQGVELDMRGPSHMHVPAGARPSLRQIRLVDIESHIAELRPQILKWSSPPRFATQLKSKCACDTPTGLERVSRDTQQLYEACILK